MKMVKPPYEKTIQINYKKPYKKIEHQFNYCRNYRILLIWAFKLSHWERQFHGNWNIVY